MAYIPQPDLGTCVVVDDVLATGGTMEAASKLCEMVGLKVIDRICLLDIGFYKVVLHPYIKYNSPSIFIMTLYPHVIDKLVWKYSIPFFF